MRFCKNCYAAMEEDMIFCPGCGIKYFVHDTNIYSAPDSPVIIVEQNLLFIKGRIFLFLTFGNISEENICACSVNVHCKDQLGDTISYAVFKYNDLNVAYGEKFGDKKIFEITDLDTRNISVVIEKVLLKNGKLWELSDAVFSPTNDYEDFKKSDYDKLGMSIYDMNEEERARKESEAIEIWKQLEECWKANKKHKLHDEAVNSRRDLIIAKHPDILVPSYVSKIESYMFCDCKPLRSIYITKQQSVCEHFYLGWNIKVAVIPHDMKVYKYSFSLYTKVIRDKDPEVIQKRRNEQYLAEQAEQKRRNEKYWAEHTDEKQRLDAECASLINENKSLQEQVITFNKKITSLKDMCNGAVPSQTEKDKILNEISALRKEYTHLGLFKGKQKKALQNKIDELNLKISDLDSLIKAEEIEKEKQQKSCSDKIKEIEEHLKPVKDRITAIDKRIMKINAELTKNR